MPDYDPHVSGSNVVWAGYDGNDYEIFFYNGSTTVGDSVTQVGETCANLYCHGDFAPFSPDMAGSSTTTHQ